MSNQRPEYFAPALIAGAAAGILSGVPFSNCLCCLWIIGGAVLATYLLAGRTPAALTAGDGAIVGALTGIVAGMTFTTLIMLTPLGKLLTNYWLTMAERMSRFSGQEPPQLAELKQLATKTGFRLSGYLLNIFVFSAIFAVLGVLGGVIGASLFGRKKSPVPPPPAPSPQGPTDAAV